MLNAAFFLGEEAYKKFIEEIPSLRFFQLQREGMGNESLIYTFMVIARCDKVYQWGFDETSLNGIATLNQWCRIREGNEYRNVTIECAGNPNPNPNPDPHSNSNPHPFPNPKPNRNPIIIVGLLPGGTSDKVAEHVKVTWERGKRAIDILRAELGAEVDELVPLINGGVTLTKACGAMHDTCNTANLTATKVNPNPNSNPTLSLIFTQTLTQGEKDSQRLGKGDVRQR